jgi:integrase
VDDITGGDIAHLLSAIWIEKQETARRVLQRLKVIFDWAAVNGYRTGPNPTDGVKMALPRQKPEVRHFAAVPWEETSSLMAQLEETAAIGAKALRFTILTALRSGPVRHATWDQFNESLSVWTIPAANMKGGKQFLVPLPTSAIDLLREVRERRSEASPYVFASPSNPTKPISENTMAKVLNQFYPDATVHGMRSAFRDWAEIFAEAPREVIHMPPIETFHSTEGY